MHLFTLHQALKDLRVSKGITQDELALAIGVARTSITNMEQGRQPISIQHTINILDHLGYTADITLRKIR